MTRAALQAPLSCSYLISSMAIKGWLSSEEASGPKKQQTECHKNTGPRRGKEREGREIQIILDVLFLTAAAHPGLEGGWVLAPKPCCA